MTKTTALSAAVEIATQVASAEGCVTCGTGSKIGCCAYIAWAVLRSLA